MASTKLVYYIAPNRPGLQYIDGLFYRFHRFSLKNFGSVLQFILVLQRDSAVRDFHRLPKRHTRNL